MCEKYLAKGKNVFWAFMDLEKAYKRIEREGVVDCSETVWTRW